MTSTCDCNCQKVDDDVADLKLKVNTLENKVDTQTSIMRQLVSQTEFLPVKLITYGIAGGCMTAVLGALLFKVISK